MTPTKIAIAGLGYVGLSNTVLLAQHKPLNFKATLDKFEAYAGAAFVIIAKVYTRDLFGQD